MNDALQTPIRIMVVDDHELLRTGVCALLSRIPHLSVVAQAENGAMALEKCKETQVDLILMDIHMPVMDGLEATKRIKRQYPDVKILVLTVSDTENMLFQAIKSGASGYVLKSAEPTAVVDAIDRVSAGEPVIPGNLAIQIITDFSKRSTDDSFEGRQGVVPLTDREIEVLRLLGTGASNKDIAQTLYISEYTARNHVRSILEKLHVKNRVEAATFALREGIVVEDGEVGRPSH